MEQLSFTLIYEKNKLKSQLFDWKEVKIKGKLILLGEWEPVSPKEYYHSNWVRRICPNDGFSCVGLMISWSSNLSCDKFCWKPMFLGSDLHDLDKIYNEFYPQDKPSYRNDQLEEAKKHLDNFIVRVNSLKIFI